MASYLLHGTLHVTIYEAENIINTERTTGGAPAFFRRVRFVWLSFFVKGELLCNMSLYVLDLSKVCTVHFTQSATTAGVSRVGNSLFYSFCMLISWEISGYSFWSHHKR
jgi:hypothetical protein